MGLVSFGALAGASLGSFAIATGLRICFDNRPFSAPSRCDHCQKKLKWHQLIPVISYLFFMGRCGCKTYQLPAYYVISELLGFGIGGLLFFYHPPVIAGLYLVFISLLVICMITDATALILSVPALIFIAISGLCFQIVQLVLSGSVAGFRDIAGIFTVPVCGFFLFWAIELGYQRRAGRAGLGAGDKWLIASIALWTDLNSAVIILNLASLFGLAHAGHYRLFRNTEQKQKLPFGLYLCAASILIAPLQ